MSDDQQQEFRDPELAINRVYTGQGDAGSTKLVGGQRVPKSDLRIATYGTVDELNACVGAARQTITDDYPAHRPFKKLSTHLFKIQHQLFNLGSVLATLPEDVGPQMPRITPGDVERLEALIDEYNEHCPPLRSFVLPGGTRLNVDFHLARTVCRRAERLVVALADDPEAGVSQEALIYLNRLSDAFFVWSRWVTLEADVPEVLWNPNA